MFPNQNVSKPKPRSALRSAVGKRYFILKRRLQWWFGKDVFAKIDPKVQYPHSLIQHRTLLLRPLKEVDMQLQRNKVVNLSLAIRHLNKIVIRPGETFSIWRRVGRPTQAKGYLEGLALHHGQVTKDIGGGLCQLGNLIYWMALHSPLTIKERWRHGYDVFPDLNRTIPFACGATLSYNYIDLQLQNNTSQHFQINLWLDQTHLNGEITCNQDLQTHFEVIETDHIFRQQWWGGYTRHNKIWKKTTHKVHGTTSEELIAENHALMMYNPMLEG